MKHSIRVLFASVLLALATTSVFAGGKSSGYTGSKTVHVQAYTRKDGTYVHAHDRAAPGTASSIAPLPNPSTTRVSSAVTPATLANVPKTSNWVPAKFVNGEYVPPHIKQDEKAATSTKTTPSLNNGSLPTQPIVLSSPGVQRDSHGRFKRSEPAT